MVDAIKQKLRSRRGNSTFGQPFPLPHDSLPSVGLLMRIVGVPA